MALEKSLKKYRNIYNKAPVMMHSVDRKGKIISVDVVNNAANVKIEITSGPYLFTDFLLLLKIKDDWKIIQKSYTRVRVG